MISVITTTSLLVPIVVTVATSILSVPSIAKLGLILLALLPFLLPLLFALFLTASLLSMVQSSCLISVCFKLLFSEEEVDLHLLLGIGQVVLFMDADHLVQGSCALLVIDFEQNTKLVVSAT